MCLAETVCVLLSPLMNSSVLLINTSDSERKMLCDSSKTCKKRKKKTLFEKTIKLKMKMNVTVEPETQ